MCDALLTIGVIFFSLATEASHKRAAPSRAHPSIVITVGDGLAKKVIRLCIGDTPGETRAEHRPSSHNADRDNHLRSILHYNLVEPWSKHRCGFITQVGSLPTIGDGVNETELFKGVRHIHTHIAEDFPQFLKAGRLERLHRVFNKKRTGGAAFPRFRQVNGVFFY